MKAIDTNVLVYTVDFSEPVKQTTALDLVTRLASSPEPAVLPWQVAAEYLGWLRRKVAKGKLSAVDLPTFLSRGLSWLPLQLPSPGVIDVAVNLFDRYSLSHWDSMLLAACTVAGVDKLYSEDMQHGTTYGSVTIENPFV